MAIAEGNERVAVVLPRALADAIRTRQVAAREAPKPGAYIRAHLADWLTLEDRLGRLESTVADQLGGVTAGLREVLSALAVLQDDIQAAGLVPQIPDGED